MNATITALPAQFAPIPRHQGHASSTHQYVQFETPGQQIGELVSYCSNLPADYRRNFLSVAFAAASLAITCMFFGFAIPMFIFSAPLSISLCISTALGILAFGSVWHFGDLPHFCNYVGAEGIARFTCRNGNVKRIVTRKIFRFEDADKLEKKIVRHNVNGIYTGTTYHLSWQNAEGQPLFTLTTAAKDHAKSSIDSEVPFLLAAENQWNTYVAKHDNEFQS